MREIKQTSDICLLIDLDKNFGPKEKTIGRFFDIKHSQWLPLGMAHHRSKPWQPTNVSRLFIFRQIRISTNKEGKNRPSNNPTNSILSVICAYTTGKQPTWERSSTWQCDGTVEQQAGPNAHRIESILSSPFLLAQQWRQKSQVNTICYNK